MRLTRLARIRGRQERLAARRITDAADLMSPSEGFDAHRALLIGTAILGAIEHGNLTWKALAPLLDTSLVADNDRALFGLSPIANN